MRLIALNGFAYRLDKWLAPEVETPFRINWTRRSTERFSRTITTPAILVGFSDGATAATHIALTNRNIVEAYIHSPMPWHGTIEHIPDKIKFYRTAGDTTPTFRGALENHTRILHVSTLVTLPFVPFDSPTWFERFALARRHHIFHNCLDRLPAEFTKQRSSIGGEAT